MKFILLLLTLTSLTYASPIVTLNSSNSVAFSEPVSEASVARISLELMVKSAKLPKGSPIYLVLDTPGGSVSAGTKFIDIVKALGRPVHTITVFAASMGYQIAQELDNRYILPSGTLMSHRGAISGIGGQIPGELNTRIKMIEEVLDGMNERASKRIKMNKKAYQDSIVNELWLTGQDAVNKHNADLVILATCDKTLLGTRIEKVSTIFGIFDVEYSNCPLISYPISVTSGKNKFLIGTRVYQEVVNRTRKVYLSF